ncbi:MAG: lysophospholipid acyltransferase family protein [Verrucomicrobiota bacterium]
MQPPSSDNSRIYDDSDVLLGTVPSLRKATCVALQLLKGLLFFRGLQAPNAPSEHPVALLERARHLQKLTQLLLRHLEIDVRVSGPIPQSGLLVANHVSFADILVLGSIRPTVFVSKAEVANWPIVGPIAANAGTLFVQRQRRSDVARVNANLKAAFDEGLLVTLFPEGTSSDGQTVLPFMPSLLQPAIDTQAAVTPAHLRYTNTQGERVDEVAYFGDRELQDCLWALVQRTRTIANVRFGQTIRSSSDRKTLAADLFAQVNELAAPSA